ncbi:F-box/LRR-repeat protein 18-like [Patiria miniata]|uniref:F-box domain-containing protein n=1 Tax=Patiria miniata TaxID=46514 RepID=A0A914B0K7_PATMI|nr:F-box/LRR-repeat protein 18-like [Patiria miniata]
MARPKRDTDMTALTLDSLPAEIIFKILEFLPIRDILSVADLGPTCRLGWIANDPSVFRNLTLSKCFHLTRDTLKLLLARRRDDIQYLDISNCYWLAPEDFGSLDFRLPNLRHLDARHTHLPFKTLHKILAHTKSLRSLSYDQTCGVKICDISRAAVRTLHRLRELNVVYIPGICAGKNGERSLLEYGKKYRKLEAFGVDAGYTENVDMECSCGARLDDVIPFENLKHFMIGQGARDAHRRSVDFNFVSLTANQCSVLFTDGCFRTVKSQGDDHLSATAPQAKIFSLQMVHVPDLKLPSYRSLRYLNIAGSVEFTGLCTVARNCPLLESLNLSFCRDALKKVYKCEEWTDLSAFRIFAAAKTPLKHLNISGLHPHLPDNELCEVLALLPGLVSISLPVCGLPERKVSVPVDGLTFSQIRSRTRSCGAEDFKCDHCSRNEWGSPGTSITKESTKQEVCTYCTSDLSQLVKGCSKIRSFELIKTGFASFLSPRSASKDEDVIRCGDIMDPESTLLCISRWRHLNSLVLAGLPSIFHGRSLVAITQGCPELRRLSLAHLGPHPYDQCLFMEGLCEALKYAKRLQDFRLEQPKLVAMQSLLQSLQCCKRLQRVCVITQCGRIKALEELDDVMDRCTELVCLQVICNAYFELCANWQQALLNKYKPSRPALHVLIVSYKKCEATRWRDVCNKIPFVHLDELTLFQTRVATQAPSWREIKKIRQREHMED